MMFVRRDGSVLNFCSRKCRENQLHLKREGRLQKWTSKQVVVRSEKKTDEKKDSVLAKEIDEKLAQKDSGKGEKKK
jgi:large subunit ribosomal protein L24e